MNVYATNDEALELVKKSKVIDIYYELIKAQIDRLRIESVISNRETMIDQILEFIEKLREV